MSKALYSNNAESITAASILAADLTLTVATGDGVKFPAPIAEQHFIVTLTDGTNYEIIKVTTKTTDTFTIERAQEGTTALDWAAGSTVSQRLTAGAFQALLDLEGTKLGALRSVAAGIGSTATGNNSVSIGKNAAATKVESVALGYGCTSSYNRAVAIGRNCTSSYEHTVSIGNQCASSAYYSTAMGYSCNASGDYSVAVGYKAATTGRNGTAVGQSAQASGSKSVAIGTGTQASSSSSIAIGASAKSSSGSTVAIGSLSKAIGTSSVVLGARAYTANYGAIALGERASAQAREALSVGFKAYNFGTYSNLIGTRGNNTLPDSTRIQGAISIRNSFASTAPHRDFAGAEVVFMTEAMPLTAIGSKVIQMPTGAVFLPTSAGIMVTDQTGVITTQATVQVSTSIDNITFTPLTAAALTTLLTAPRTFQDLLIGAQTSSGLYLKGEVTVAGVSTLLYNARFYFKGVVVQE